MFFSFLDFSGDIKQGCRVQAGMCTLCTLKLSHTCQGSHKSKIKPTVVTSNKALKHLVLKGLRPLGSVFLGADFRSRFGKILSQLVSSQFQLTALGSTCGTRCSKFRLIVHISQALLVMLVFGATVRVQQWILLDS